MPPETVGVVSIGEMGGSIARALGAGGLRTVTLLEGRSRTTRDAAGAAGVRDAGSPAALVRQADVVLSVVPPGAALEVARTVATGIREAGEPVPFVDLNAIGPGTVRTIADEILADVPVIDGCLIGPAADLEAVTVYLSGPNAARLDWLDRYGLETVVLGERVGQASGLKLCFAGMTKATSVIGLDLLLGAIALGIEEPLMALYRRRLPPPAQFLEARLPGNPKRAGRRADEMAELAGLLESLSISGAVFEASHDRLRWLDGLGLDTDDAGSATEMARRVADTATGRDVVE